MASELAAFQAVASTYSLNRAQAATYFISVILSTDPSSLGLSTVANPGNPDGLSDYQTYLNQFNAATNRTLVSSNFATQSAGASNLNYPVVGPTTNAGFIGAENSITGVTNLTSTVVVAETQIGAAAVANNPALITGQAVPSEIIPLTINIDTITVNPGVAATVTGLLSDAANATLNTGDTVNGNGTTILSLVVNAGAAAEPIADINNLASINVNLASNAAGGGTLNMAEFDGIANVAITQGTNGQVLDISEAQLDTTYAINLARSVTVSLTSFETDTGDADLVLLSATGAGRSTSAGTFANAAVFDLNDGTTAIENARLATSGTNYVSIVDGNETSTYTISGSGINEIYIEQAAATATIDASTSTGTNRLVLGDGEFNSADTIRGGTGTDTFVTTLAAGTTAATVSGVENLELTFQAAGTFFSGVNTTGINRITIGDFAIGPVNSDESMNLTRLTSSVSEIRVATPNTTSADVLSIAYNTGTSSAQTLRIGDRASTPADVDIGTVSITNNSGALTINSIGADGNSTDTITANAVAAALTITTEVDTAVTNGTTTADINAINATSFTVTTAGGDFAVDDDININDAATISFNALNGAIAITAAVGATVTSAVEGVNINVVAAADDANDFGVDVFDVATAGAINLTASGGADITVGNIAVSGATVDAINLTANGSGSVVTVTDLTTGATTVSAVTINSDADGTVSFTATDATLTIDNIDASNSAGALTIDVSSLAAGVNVTTGGGAAIVTLSNNADTFVAGSGGAIVATTAGADTITLSSADDVVVFSTQDGSQVSDFTAGTGNDIAGIEVSVAAATAWGDGTAGPLTSDGGAISAATGVVLQSLASGAAWDYDTGSILVLTGVIADDTALVFELNTYGSVTDNLSATNDNLLVAYYDGANVQIRSVQYDSSGAGDISGAAVNGAGASILGIDVTSLVAGNFDFT